MDEPWGRRENETGKAYAAFLEYLRLPSHLRSVGRAYRSSQKLDEASMVTAPSNWRDWAARHEWMERATSWDKKATEDDLDKWEKRRAAAKERDWDQAERLRAIVDEALPSVNRFFRRNVGAPQGGEPTVINQEGQVIRQGTPSQVIITVAFDVTGMTKVLMDASKLQRLVLDEPTDNINNLSGFVLDAALERALTQRALEDLADSGETADAPEPFEETASEAESDFDGGAEDGME